MRRRAIFAFALALTAGTAQCLELKGLRVDQQVDCAAVKVLETRTGTFSDACNNGRPEWYVETNFLSGKAMLRLTQSADRTLLTISIGEVSTFNFEEALDALTVKFSSPQSVVKSTIQNRMGASFDQVEAIWIEGDEKLVLRKHGASIGRPWLMYMGKRAGEEANKQRVDRAKTAAGNI